MESRKGMERLVAQAHTPKEEKAVFMKVLLDIRELLQKMPKKK